MHIYCKAKKLPIRDLPVTGQYEQDEQYFIAAIVHRPGFIIVALDGVQTCLFRTAPAAVSRQVEFAVSRTTGTQIGPTIREISRALTNLHFPVNLDLHQVTLFKSLFVLISVVKSYSSSLAASSHKLSGSIESPARANPAPWLDNEASQAARKASFQGNHMQAARTSQCEANMYISGRMMRIAKSISFVFC